MTHRGGCNENCVNWVEQLQSIDDLRSQSVREHHRELIHHYIPSPALRPVIVVILRHGE